MQSYDEAMAEILLVRHAKSLANKRDFTTFGNEDSPLEIEKGIPQARGLAEVFRNAYNIDPPTYDRPVMASEYTRAYQTAREVGFQQVDASGILDESRFSLEELSPEACVRRHASEGWVPLETAERALRFVKLVQTGELSYQVYFSHGMMIAGIMQLLADEADIRGEVFPHEFRKGRGYIPDLATIIPVNV